MRDEELRRIIDEADAEIRASLPEPEPHYLRPVQASLLDPAEELAAAKADPIGRELSPAAQALYEAEGAARFATMHRGRNRPWEWTDGVPAAPAPSTMGADQVWSARRLSDRKPAHGVDSVDESRKP